MGLIVGTGDSAVSFASGSGCTKFGDTKDDVHQMTGSFRLQADTSSNYAAIIDNDENSAGHGLKVTSDGSGTGTNLLDVESGSTTVFRVRADGKVAIGTTSGGGIPTQVEALTVDGDLSLRDYLKRRGDSNTYIGMPADDQIELVAGGVTFVSITEDDSQDQIVFNDGAADVDFIVESPSEPKAIYLNAGNEVLHINHGESNFQTKIHNTNDLAVTINSDGVIFNDDSHATNDFRVETDNNTHMLFIDAGTDKVGIGTSTPYTALSVVHDYSTTTFENQLSDNEGGGEIIKYGAGSLTAGTLYYLHTDGTWTATDADAIATGGSQLLGIALGDSPGSDGVLLKGFFKVASGNIEGSSVIGAPVYVSEAPGKFDFTPPSDTDDFVRIIGYCIDIDSSDILLYFSPDSTWVVVA